eukprot:2929988-Amphidinium_carterae.1
MPCCAHTHTQNKEELYRQNSRKLTAVNRFPTRAVSVSKGTAGFAASFPKGPGLPGVASRPVSQPLGSKSTSLPPTLQQRPWPRGWLWSQAKRHNLRSGTRKKSGLSEVNKACLQNSRDIPKCPSQPA